jgi:hypothetical protein
MSPTKTTKTKTTAGRMVANTLTEIGVTSAIASYVGDGVWSFGGMAHDGRRTVHVAPGGPQGSLLVKTLNGCLPGDLVPGDGVTVVRAGGDMYGRPAYLISTGRVPMMSPYIWSPQRGWIERSAA